MWISALGLCLAAEPDKKPAPKNNAQEETKSAPVTKKASIQIDGRKIDYEVTAGKLTIEKGRKPVRAEIFHVSYIKTPESAPEKRPVLFAFNGGPGSSAVWLHIGMLGPRILDLPGDGTGAPQPPVRIKDNPYSLLDVCDLVFIDPVSTGYSRSEDKDQADEFHGLNEDIESVGEFIRRWITEHKRWSSPKFLLGESYGGVRAAGLAQHLQSRHGMSLNGVVMLSSLMDFGTLSPAQGNDLSYLVFLPTYTTVALHHGKIQGDRDALLKQARDFSYGDYATALLRGNALPSKDRGALAARLAELTGIPAAVWIRHHLRMTPGLFRAELLRDQGKTLGRFDARVAWDQGDSSAQTADYDPSYSLAYGAFATAMNDYLGRELGYTEEQPYEILTGKVNPWKWDSQNAVVNVSDRLESAMRDNPQLRVFVMSGHADLATPPDSMAHSIRHLLGQSPDARQRFRTVEYDAGHMFYLNPPDLVKSCKDLKQFITGQ